MAEAVGLDGERVVTRLRSAFNHDADRARLLEIAAESIRAAGEPYTSVYLYMLHGDELVLEAHSGRETEHQRIKVGHGVCGTAVASAEDQNVADVTGAENYIACNAFTRSELVVLIERAGKILGQIDIDSDRVGSFTEAEHAAIRRIADGLAVLL